MFSHKPRERVRKVGSEKDIGISGQAHMFITKALIY